MLMNTYLLVIIIFNFWVCGLALPLEQIGGESLPPDTFRKLAQALYQRGDKSTNRLQRKYFYNKSITCNDGSVGGYYIRRNSQSKRWIVFLEGGWYCHDILSCEARWSRLHRLMSSERWPSVKTVGGILSSDPDENPYFADANHVFVPYCSSDSWSGTASMGQTGTKFAFMGKLILKEVIHELSYFENLSGAERLYLSGSSAGGTGVLLNLDSVRSWISEETSAGPLVRGISDSGWFIDSNPFAGCDESGVCSPVGAIKKGIRLWKAEVNDRCSKAFDKDSMWNCFFGYKTYSFITSPLFIFQYQFDEAQMIADNVGAPVTKAQWNLIHGLGNRLRSTFNNVTAVFSPACISHSVLTKPEWIKISIDEVTLPQALKCWNNYLDGIQNESWERHKSKLSMYADAPHRKRYKLASNLVRSMDGGGKNSIATRLSNRMSASKLRDGVNNRTFEKIKKSRQIKNRKRRKRLKRQRCKKNPASCIPDSPRVKKSNRSLLRSLDRRSSKRRKNLRQRKNKKKRKKRKKKKKKNKRKLKTRSVSEVCPMKLIDMCSWPQCNRSCPKLHNPVTGEEMDFLDLLKSFGLDLRSVARALGVDIATLNNMDKDVLIHLLTSQSGA